MRDHLRGKRRVRVDAVVLAGLLRRRETDHRSGEADARLQVGDGARLGKIRIAAQQRVVDRHGLGGIELAEDVQGDALPAGGRQRRAIAGVARDGLDVDDLVQVEVPQRDEGQDHHHHDQKDHGLAMAQPVEQAFFHSRYSL